eukprot:CAMPEP_0180379816 /NCGR_PEP_ID=MMETSP0989-20121125/25600_1 /TAXON_ID=697907 /ORGANISM="non described non described, Strain CCMP2293" /LENGTH=283 /DNA_ID=CAMNT_0022379023 /DNA_START=58 /DNA_END=906 /DNA_ORIENTATION=-
MRILAGLVLLAPLLAAGSVGPQPAVTRFSARVSALRGGRSSGSGLREREEEAAGGWLDLSASEQGSADAAGWPLQEPPRTVAGTLDDSACWSGVEGIAAEQHESGPSPVSATPTEVSSSELRDLMVKLQGRYTPADFDAFAHTSIDFAEDVSRALTGDGILREVPVPVLMLDAEGDGVEWGDMARHSRTATVAHFPESMRTPAVTRLSALFALWGKRPPTHMRLGPSGEEIGPYLPNLLDGYWEPGVGRLVVGSPGDADLLQAREAAEAALQGRMLAYARATD